MAIVTLPAAAVTFTMKDASGSKGYLQLNVASTAASGTVLTEAAGIIPEIQAVTGCSVEKFNLTYTSIETEPAAPLARSRVEKKGQLSIITVVGKVATLAVPGFRDDFILEDGRIDEDATEVAAFTGALIGGSWTDSNGQGLSALTQAYERYAKSRPRQLPSMRIPDANTDAESDGGA